MPDSPALKPAVTVPPEAVRLLGAIADGVSCGPGGELLSRLVTRLAEAAGARLALVAERTGPARVQVLAEAGGGAHGAGAELDLAGSLAASVLEGQAFTLASGWRALRPDDPLAPGGADAGLALPLAAPDGRVLGLLAVADEGPLAPDAWRVALLRIFAARAAAELARRDIERTLRESEEAFRDLFDEAPIAYVHEDLESRFLRANRAALKILGVRPDEVPQMVGRSLVPDTPEAQQRVREAFESIGRGTDASGVVLELRRKDDGRPIFIEWWSRPDRSGTFTRTMFLDITDRVLLEQEHARLRQQNTYLREEIKSVHNFDEIVGQAPALVEVLGHVERVARTDSSVLITGETGTGKELIARVIHSSSRRRDRPLIKLNCAALPTGLVESELFGHEKGAFSGAVARRIGRFELAHGGTIFLDEIGEVPPDVQVKLLRVLQEREFERVGGTTPIRVDVRVIAATNRDLPRAIAAGTFRQDLYYRLNVFPVALPPLRDRTTDIPLLVQAFLRKFNARIGKAAEGVTDELLQRLLAYAWPGNVRELENLIERAVILSDARLLGPDAIPSLVESVPGPAAPGRAGQSLLAVERAHIEATLQEAGWVIEGEAGAARRLGLHPNTLRSRLKKLGIARR